MEAKRDLAALYTVCQKELDQLENSSAENSRISLIIGKFMGVYVKQGVNPRVDEICYQSTDYTPLSPPFMEHPVIIQWDGLPDYAGFRKHLEPPQKT